MRRVLIRKAGRQWVVLCPCGYVWRTIHHPMALRFASFHEHLTDRRTA